MDWEWIMYRSGTDFDCPTKRGRLNVLRTWSAIELVLRTTLDPPQSAQTLRETPVRTADSPQINLKKHAKRQNQQTKNSYDDVLVLVLADIGIGIGIGIGIDKNQNS